MRAWSLKASGARSLTYDAQVPMGSTSWSQPLPDTRSVRGLPYARNATPQLEVLDSTGIQDLNSSMQ